MNSIKQNLYTSCKTHIESRINTLKHLIKNIQKSANEETKSTAGDKYETGRAMAQLEIDKYQSQLVEALKMKQELLRVPVKENTPFISAGSLIFTSRGNFYIAINAGQQQLEGQTFFTVSPASPIARKLIGLKVGDSFVLNNQEFSILKIY